jgi:hypothetical protein
MMTLMFEETDARLFYLNGNRFEKKKVETLDLYR